MPYIKPARRPSLDPIIDGLIKRLKEIDCVKGDVNYAVTRIAVECLNEHGYHSISDCISVLRDAADEIQRRLLGPYEDTAIIRNGDLGCFQTSYAYSPLEFVQEQQCEPWVVDSPLPSVQEVAEDMADKIQKDRQQFTTHCGYCEEHPEDCEGCGPTDD
jgi:hypothetical protein